MSNLCGLFVFTLLFLLSYAVETSNSSNWAVLVAGSNNYYNYRHQADIAHAYKILTEIGGFPSENIIVMMYNDIVNNTQNPFPGQLFNEPGGIDVYGNIVIDYVGNQVTAQNFLNVIKGIETESGLPVLHSKENDNVFIYYSDHGATGLVAMPSGGPLYADDLIDALHYMYNHSMYSELVFYLEACESGSMFDTLLPKNISIYATTAANPSESSYAYYYNDTLGTYMADEYSIRWMQDSTNNWDTWESLWKQFKDVKNIVNFSHPQEYGTKTFLEDAIENFQAFQIRKKHLSNKQITTYTLTEMISSDSNWIPSRIAVSARDVKLATLQNRYLDSQSIETKMHYSKLIKDELHHRLWSDELFKKIVISVSGVDIPDFNNAIANLYLKPTDFGCLKSVFQQFENECERFTDYSLKYVSVLVNLCEIYGSDEVLDGVIDVCH